MSRHKLFHEEPKFVRDSLLKCRDISKQIHALEKELVQTLHFINRRSFFVRIGYKSLSGYCRFCLKFSRTQSQRIATSVRRLQTTANIEQKTYTDWLEKTRNPFVPKQGR